MKKLVLIFILIYMNLCYCLGQMHGFLKYDIGESYDQVQFNSNSNLFRFYPSRSAITSFIYEQKIIDFLSVETGVQDRYFETGVSGYLPDTFYIGAASNYLTIPLRIILYQKIGGNISLLQRFGANLSIAHSFSGLDNRFTINDYTIKVNRNFPKTYFTFDLGLGIEWTFSKSKSWKLTFIYDYNISPKQIVSIDIHDSNNSNYSHFESSGQYQTFMLGIGYRISNLWIKNNAHTANTVYAP